MRNKRVCGCENSECETGHMTNEMVCASEGTVPVEYVGQVCEACAEYMPKQYILPRFTEELVAVVYATGRQVQVEIGPWDNLEDRFRFGWSSELWVQRAYGEALTVDVGFSSVGSLPASDAYRRAESYRTAARIGMFIEQMRDRGKGLVDLIDELAEATSPLYSAVDVRDIRIDDIRKELA